MTALLEVSGATKRFGAFLALDGVTLDVREGETLGLIGPNGAGKTTLFNVVTGFLRPDGGGVRFAGETIDALSPAARAGRGLVRTFQKAMLFPELTLRENLAMAVRRRDGHGTRWFGARRFQAAAVEEADALLGRAGLGGRGGERLRGLSYGEQRIVDLLVSLALRPRLLLLDEPTAGLAPEEARRLLALVRAPGEGRAVVLITHDVEVALGGCDRVAVLHLGRLLRLGTPEEVRADPGVRAAYLGALAG